MPKDRRNPFEATQPAREYFVGRARELIELEGYLDTILSGGATNVYIVGGGGDGKTSFLYRIIEEATKRGMLASIITLDRDMKPDDFIVQLIRAVLKKIATQYKRDEYQKDFQEGAKSVEFAVAVASANGNTVHVQDVEHDFARLIEICHDIDCKGIVMCVDEGQVLKIIDGGSALIKLRGAIQSVGRSFMIALAAIEDVIPEVAVNNTGVDRFFPNRLSMGAFDSENVAIEAIEARLKGKPVQFPRPISELIVRISENHPKPIVDISHDVYAEAMNAGVSAATAPMVRDAVYNRYRQHAQEVMSIIDGLLPMQRGVLQRILAFGSKFTVDDIAKTYCPGADLDCLERMKPTVQIDLQSLVERGLCNEVAERQGRLNYASVGGIRGFFIEAELGFQKGGS